jgi:hypothetical protein
VFQKPISCAVGTTVRLAILSEIECHHLLDPVVNGLKVEVVSF